MDDLIARLEAAPEGSRELDAALARLIGLHDVHLDRGCWFHALGVDEDGGPWPVVPYFTTSLDAALTLVPEGWEWTLYSDGSGEIYRKPPPGQTPNNAIVVEAETQPLTMCAAALKARSLPWVTTSTSPSPS